MSNSHKYTEIDIDSNGRKLPIDLGIVDLVLWLNSLPGVSTRTSCQGGSLCCSMDAFVGLDCSDPESFALIQSFISDYGEIETNSSGGHRLNITTDCLAQLNADRFPESQYWPDADEPMPPIEEWPEMYQEVLAEIVKVKSCGQAEAAAEYESIAQNLLTFWCKVLGKNEAELTGKRGGTGC